MCTVASAGRTADVSSMHTAGAAQQRCLRQGTPARFGPSVDVLSHSSARMACAFTPLMPKELVPAGLTRISD